MHRGAGAHCVTARPVLVEKTQPHFQEQRRRDNKGDACLQVGGCSEGAAGGAVGRRDGGGVSDCVCKEQAVCGMRASRSPRVSLVSLSGQPSAGRRRHAHPFCALVISRSTGDAV